MGQRCEAPAEAGKDDELKGRKRHRGRKGRTAQGKMQKGGGLQVALREALAQGWQVEGMVQIQQKLNGEKEEKWRLSRAITWK